MLRLQTYDPELGWIAEPREPENPDGLTWPPALDRRPKAWFFGDSFIAGGGNSIPALFEALRPEWQSLNYGVGGYGLDQIWLRYRRVSEHIPPGAPVLVGVLTYDLDRSALRFYAGFKPIFRRVNGSYRLVPPPSREELPGLYESITIPITSYVLAGLGTLVEQVTTNFNSSRIRCHLREKMAVNSYLIDQIISKAAEKRHGLYWILFGGRDEIGEPAAWRYDFLREALDRSGQPYLDTLDVLRRSARAAGQLPTAFYNQTGHLTLEGRGVVAEALAASFNRIGSKAAPGAVGLRDRRVRAR